MFFEFREVKRGHASTLATSLQTFVLCLDSRTPVRYRTERMYAAGLSTRPLRSAHRGGGRVHGLGCWVLVTGALVGASLALARVAAGATAPVERMVVQPGDSLWSIAAARYPSDDPRERVDAIERLNGLSGPTIVVGESLLLPPGS